VYDLAGVLFPVATGFVAGGLIGSLNQMLTQRPASFQNIGETVSGKFWAAFVITFGGPMIIMRNAIRGRLIERRPVGWLAASSAIATGWSFASGVCLLNLTLAIQAQFAA